MAHIIVYKVIEITVEHDVFVDFLYWKKDGKVIDSTTKLGGLEISTGIQAELDAGVWVHRPIRCTGAEIAELPERNVKIHTDGTVKYKGKRKHLDNDPRKTP